MCSVGWLESVESENELLWYGGMGGGVPSSITAVNAGFSVITVLSTCGWALIGIAGAEFSKWPPMATLCSGIGKRG